MLSEIQVIFQIPAWIQEGLNNGTLERVGGVIRDSVTKQVQAWLQEGGLSETERPSEILSQQMSQLAMNGKMVMGLQVANLAVSAVGFAVIYRKLQAVEKRLSGQLKSIDKNLKWLDRKDMLKQVSHIAGAIQGLKEHELYQDKSTASHLLNAGLHDLQKCQIYFHQLIKDMLGREAQFSMAEELAVCYKAWVMASTGRIQILHAKNEVPMALAVSNEFKTSHGMLGARLWEIQNDEYLQFSNAKTRINALVNEAIGVDEISRGNCLQLEYLSQGNIQVPAIDRNTLQQHDGFVVYSIAN